MKKYVQLFEDFIREDDSLDSLSLDLDLDDKKDKGKKEKKTGEEDKEKKKKEEDPLDDVKKKKEKEEKKAEAKHNKIVDQKLSELKDLLNANSDIEDGLRDRIIHSVKDQDRVKIHNAVNDLIYLQQKLGEEGKTKAIEAITKIKAELDTLDQSFTNSKRI